MRLALILVALVFALVAPPSGAATPKASLRLLDETAPPTLRGSGFQPREHVRVVIVAGSTRTVKRVVATALGRFGVRVRDVDDCAGFSATAVGSKGTRASLKRVPGQCPQLQP